jgi:uridylate kinase
MKNKEKIIVLSLGGSLIIPPEGFNVKFLKGFKKMILSKIKNGYRFIVVCGGGATSRLYQNAAKDVGQIVAEDVDWIGIHATRLNAHFVRTIFRKWANPVVVKNPTKKVNWTEPVLIAAGWKPGWSTDYDAIKLAELYGAERVINLSNIVYVYSDDPKKNKNAKKIKDISWKEFRKIVGNEWKPGANFPFDPVASREAEKLNLDVVVMQGTKLKEVDKAIERKKCKGTLIHP